MLVPAVEHAPYDVVLDVDGVMIRVQVKSASLSRDGAVVVARLRRSRHTARSGYVAGTYSADEVDAFGVYCAEVDRCYLIPFADTHGYGIVQLRLGAARNGQRASLRFAADYEFPGAVAQLGERRAGSAKVRGSSPLSSISSESRSAPEAPSATVGAHEFRNRFGWYLERAAAGETIRVTHHGKPHVELCRPAAAEEADLSDAA